MAGRIESIGSDHSLEPNVTFTPDMKWLVVRSNMLGPTHVFAVAVDKER